MKIKLKTSRQTKAGISKAGDVIEIAKDEGERLIKIGKAEAVKAGEK